MPDMDIDFAVAGRDRVINYVREYGRPRGADHHLRTMMRAPPPRCGRVLDSYGTVDKVAKLIRRGLRFTSTIASSPVPSSSRPTTRSFGEGDR